MRYFAFFLLLFKSVAILNVAIQQEVKLCWVCPDSEILFKYSNSVGIWIGKQIRSLGANC